MDDRKNLPEHEALIRRVSATPQNQFAEFTEKKLLYQFRDDGEALNHYTNSAWGGVVSKVRADMAANAN